MQALIEIVSKCPGTEVVADAIRAFLEAPSSQSLVRIVVLFQSTEFPDDIAEEIQQAIVSSMLSCKPTEDELKEIQELQDDPTVPESFKRLTIDSCQAISADTEQDVKETLESISADEVDQTIEDLKEATRPRPLPTMFQGDQLIVAVYGPRDQENQDEVDQDDEDDEEENEFSP